MPPHLAWVALACGIVLVVTGLIWGPPDQRVATCLLAIGLSWAAFIDIDRFILPDVLTIGLIVVGLAFAAGDVGTLTDRTIGAVAGFSALALVAFLYRRLRGRHGLGLGDAKLLAAAGAWLGWFALPSVVLAGSATALVYVLADAAVRRRFEPTRAIPFGPFLAAGFWIVWLAGPLDRLPF